MLALLDTLFDDTEETGMLLFQGLYWIESGGYGRLFCCSDGVMADMTENVHGRWKHKTSAGEYQLFGLEGDGTQRQPAS